MHFKDLRHLLPTALNAFGVPAAEIQKILGHARGSMETRRCITPVGSRDHMDVAFLDPQSPASEGRLTIIPVVTSLHPTTKQPRRPGGRRGRKSLHLNNGGGGKPCIRGMRITVDDVLGYLASGMSEAEVLADFPYLEAEDIQACRAFAMERDHTGSPLDVEGIELGLTADEIVAFVREGRHDLPPREG